MTKQLVMDREEAVDYIEDHIITIAEELISFVNTDLSAVELTVDDLNSLRPRNRAYFRGKVGMLLDTKNLFDVYIDKEAHNFLEFLNKYL